jgi:hypothetical protein
MDTFGNFIWDRLYNVREPAAQLFSDCTIGRDGSIFLGGTVGGVGSIPQEALLVKLDSLGCLDSAFCYPLGIREIKEIETHQITLFPNPTQNTLNLQFADSKYLCGTASIYSADGKLLQQIKNVQHLQKIAINGYASGVYYLQYSIGDWRKSLQFVVE